MFTNYLGDEEYSSRIDHICNKLGTLFNDNKKIKRNIIFLGENIPKNAVWGCTHIYENLCRIGKVICLKKASKMFNQKQLEEFKNISITFSPAFSIDKENNIYDLQIYLRYEHDDKDLDLYLSHYELSSHLKKYGINEENENKEFLEFHPETKALTGMDMINFVIKDINLSLN